MVLEVLTDLQKRIILLFNTLPDKEAFYLTGGTALSAFYLKHRRSHDLDFFTEVEELITPFSQKLESFLLKEKMKVDRRRSLHSFIELSVKVEEEVAIIHLALDSPFRLEKVSDSQDFPGLKVDSLIDIAANKLLTLFGRAELRDFIDIYFLHQNGFDMKTLIDNARKKDPGFDLYWLGVALNRINRFPDDAQEMLLLLKPCSMRDLKGFFNSWKEKIFMEITS
jgi:predicted nucleotidyltransferase component of viral defense system